MLPKTVNIPNIENWRLEQNEVKILALGQVAVAILAHRVTTVTEKQCDDKRARRLMGLPGPQMN